MACLFCRYWIAKEPPEHRAAREAKKDYCVNKWEQVTWLHYVRSHRVYPEGWCGRQPVPVLTKASHVCGEIELTLDGWWGNDRRLVPQAVPQDQNLRAWADAALERAVNGDYVDRRWEDAEADNKRLKLELAAARKVSKSRLERLQKAEAAKPKRPKHVVEIVAFAEAAD